MGNEPPRRRVRRAKQSRPVAPGHVEPVAAAERRAGPSSEGIGGEAGLPVEVETAVVKPEGAAELPVDDAGPEAEMPPDSSRDGAWLPAGITVLVMVSLLVCAGLVLIASRQ